MLVLLLALSCAEPRIENTSGLKWNEVDQEMLDTAKKRCGVIYPDSPCVKMFRKYDFQSYSVICGKSKGERR